MESADFIYYQINMLIEISIKMVASRSLRSLNFISSLNFVRRVFDAKTFSIFLLSTSSLQIDPSCMHADNTHYFSKHYRIILSFSLDMMRYKVDYVRDWRLMWSSVTTS